MKLVLASKELTKLMIRLTTHKEGIIRNRSICDSQKQFNNLLSVGFVGENIITFMSGIQDGSNKFHLDTIYHMKNPSKKVIAINKNFAIFYTPSRIFGIQVEAGTEEETAKEMYKYMKESHERIVNNWLGGRDKEIVRISNGYSIIWTYKSNATYKERLESLERSLLKLRTPGLLNNKFRQDIWIAGLESEIVRLKAFLDTIKGED